MSEQFSIRDATFDDIDQIVNMRLSVQKHMSDRNPNLWQMSEKKVSELPLFYRTAIEEPHSSLLVVQDEKSRNLIGTGLGRVCTHDEYIPGLSGKIDDVWIEPSFRRRGLCSSIIVRLLGFFRTKHAEVLTLEYSDGNTEAKAMWHALGFKPALRIATASISDLKLQMNEI